MCSSCGTGRPTPPWEDALGTDRSHRALRARALTTAAATSSLRFTADPATRTYHVHRATAPHNVAYDLAQCCSFMSIPTPILDPTDDPTYPPPPLDCPLDVWAVVLQLHARRTTPHLIRIADSSSATDVHLHGSAISATVPITTIDGPYLHVTGPRSTVVHRALHRTAAAICHTLYPEPARAPSTTHPGHTTLRRK